MKHLHINPLDNVAVCLSEDKTIPFGHKFALSDIKKGEYVIKYGHPIGRATQLIKKGEWVHSHNLSSHLDETFTYHYQPQIKEMPKLSGTFMGYKRINRRAGIRNDIYIIPTVGCVNGVAKILEEKAKTLDLGTIDGVKAFTHQFGCSQLGEDQDNIAHLLAALALNPNATYVLFLGLGCENNALEGIKQILASKPHDHIAYLKCQDHEDEVEAAFEILTNMVEKARVLQRTPCNIDELCLGLKCGGSDALSGLTANPLVGKISDRLISMGGSAILTEVPEMFGAEQILMNKCRDHKVFEDFKKMIINFKNYYTELGFPVYENPSPGNKEGGITTLEEKSLGCIEKAGSSPIIDVLNYAEPLSISGLNVLDGPGNDLIAATALAASGAQLILFTTGRGTPFSTVVPTIKIASNHHLAIKKANWISFDASRLDEEGLFELVLQTANGEYQTKQEDIHEMAFFKKGVTL